MDKNWFCCPRERAGSWQDSDLNVSERHSNLLIDENQIRGRDTIADADNVGDSDDNPRDHFQIAMNEIKDGGIDGGRIEDPDSKETSGMRENKNNVGDCNEEDDNCHRIASSDNLDGAWIENKINEPDLPESNNSPPPNSNAEVEGDDDSIYLEVCDEGSMELKQVHSDNESLSEIDDDDASLGGVDLFDVQPQLPLPKKQFLEAALTAKSLSDLNYVHAGKDSTGTEAARWMSMSDLKYVDDSQSMDEDEVFEMEEVFPRPKKQFLEAALAAKSMSDLTFVLTVQVPETPTNQSQNDSRSIHSMDDLELFQNDAQVPRPKKQFLEAAIMAKSLSDLNYVHASEVPRALRRQSMPDIKFIDDGSLEESEVFELEAAIPRPKKQFLEAALAAKSTSDLNFFIPQSPKESKGEDPTNSNNSLNGFDLFEDDQLIPRPKKQFLEAAIMAKSLSDLDYLHFAEAPKALRRQSMPEIKFIDDGSLEESEVFELEAAIPRPKKQFLEAALAAKSISDLNFVYAAVQPQDDSASISLNCGSTDSLDDFDLFEDDPPVPRPKKQFLEAAIMAKSLSDLNYVYTAEAPTDVRWKSMTDLKYEDDSSIGDDEVFELELSIPRPKKQFLDAALAAKSISDLNFVTQAQSLDDSISLGYQCSNDSLDDFDLFEDDPPVPRPKKQFLEAAMMAKSLSDLNYVYVAQAPQDSRWKSMTDIKYNDDSSLDDDEVFEFELSIPRPKKQFLEAALTAKSISDLNFFASHTPETAQTPDTSIHQEYDASSDSLDDFALFENDIPVPRPKKQFLEAAMMAKSLSDLNYVHSAEAPQASRKARRRKSLTDLKDDDSLGDDELFELHPSVPRPKKQFLEAALMAKSLSDLKYMHMNMTTISSLKDNESRDDYTLKVVPEHLLRLSQPNLTFHSADMHSIDNSDLFESVLEDSPIERPILKAALEAKAQQAGGFVVVDSQNKLSRSNSDDQTEIVPEHLVIANQPATVHSHDNYSIEVEDIFEQPSDEQNTQKPLLKAALDAHAQRQEKFSKSISCYQGVNQGVNSLSVHRDFSKSVPDHLAIVNQPTKGLPVLDELSIDNDKLFDTPKQVGKKSLLMAALKAKEETKQIASPFGKNDLRFLSEIDQIWGKRSINTVESEAENVDESK